MPPEKSSRIPQAQLIAGSSITFLTCHGSPYTVLSGIMCGCLPYQTVGFSRIQVVAYIVALAPQIYPTLTMNMFVLSCLLS